MTIISKQLEEVVPHQCCSPHGQYLCANDRLGKCINGKCPVNGKMFPVVLTKVYYNAFDAETSREIIGYKVYDGTVSEFMTPFQFAKYNNVATIKK